MIATAAQPAPAQPEPLHPDQAPRRRRPVKHIRLGFRLTQAHADVLYLAVPLALTALGALSSRPGLWYETLGYLSVVFCGGELVLAAVWEGVAPLVARPERLQAGKTAPPMYRQEIVLSAVCMYIIACLSTWPVVRLRLGQPTAFRPTLEEASWGPLPVAFYAVKMAVVLLLSDAWTFFKHISLHNPALYVIHKAHHTFHDPSTFAGFAIHPVEALWTFGPIVCFCVPQVAIYAPIHLPALLFFFLLNLYLHCGYEVPALESAFSSILVNTSVWHNKHHELSVTHFGEMLTLWDWILGTHTHGWSKARYQSQATRVSAGQSGMDDVPTKRD